MGKLQIKVFYFLESQFLQNYHPSSAQWLAAYWYGACSVAGAIFPGESRLRSRAQIKLLKWLGDA